MKNSLFKLMIILVIRSNVLPYRSKYLSINEEKHEIRTYVHEVKCQSMYFIPESWTKIRK